MNKSDILLTLWCLLCIFGQYFLILCKKQNMDIIVYFKI